MGSAKEDGLAFMSDLHLMLGAERKERTEAMADLGGMLDGDRKAWNEALVGLQERLEERDGAAMRLEEKLDKQHMQILKLWEAQGRNTEDLRRHIDEAVAKAQKATEAILVTEVQEAVALLKGMPQLTAPSIDYGAIERTAAAAATAMSETLMSPSRQCAPSDDFSEHYSRINTMICNAALAERSASKAAVEQVRSHVGSLIDSLQDRVCQLELILQGAAHDLMADVDPDSTSSATSRDSCKPYLTVDRLVNLTVQQHGQPFLAPYESRPERAPLRVCRQSSGPALVSGVPNEGSRQGFSSSTASMPLLVPVTQPADAATNAGHVATPSTQVLNLLPRVLDRSLSPQRSSLPPQMQHGHVLAPPAAGQNTNQSPAPVTRVCATVRGTCSVAHPLGVPFEALDAARRAHSPTGAATPAAGDCSTCVSGRTGQEMHGSRRNMESPIAQPPSRSCSASGAAPVAHPGRAPSDVCASGAKPPWATPMAAAGRSIPGGVSARGSLGSRRAVGVPVSPSHPRFQPRGSFLAAPAPAKQEAASGSTNIPQGGAPH